MGFVVEYRKAHAARKETCMMPISEAKKRANAKWDSANMTKLCCRVTVWKAEAFKKACSDAGTNVNAFFLRAVDDFLRSQGIDPDNIPKP